MPSFRQAGVSSPYERLNAAQKTTLKTAVQALWNIGDLTNEAAPATLGAIIPVGVQMALAHDIATYNDRVASGALRVDPGDTLINDIWMKHLTKGGVSWPEFIAGEVCEGPTMHNITPTAAEARHHYRHRIETGADGYQGVKNDPTA